MKSHAQEVARGERFEFGANWQRFLKCLTPERIANAEQSLLERLRLDSLEGKSFLDIGSGSGLFSLAARRLGASVYSFDYDPQSVACTHDLKRRFFPDDNAWFVEEGSVLDATYMQSLGKFDVVYSWGVLHHTGAMWRAIENAMLPIADEGRFFIAIYNRQDFWTPLHTLLKKSYVSSPLPGKYLIVGAYVPTQAAKGLVKDLVLMRNPLKRYLASGTRGMSRWHDWIDWVGGYPFETATPEQIFDFCHARGLSLEGLNICRGLGCSEYVLRRSGQSAELASSAALSRAAA